MPKGQKDIGEYQAVLSAAVQLRSEVQTAQQELISLGETTVTTVSNTVNAKVTQFVNDATKCYSACPLMGFAAA